MTMYQAEVKCGKKWVPAGEPKETMTEAEIYCLVELTDEKTHIVPVER